MPHLRTLFVFHTYEHLQSWNMIVVGSLSRVEICFHHSILLKVSKMSQTLLNSSIYFLREDLSANFRVNIFFLIYSLPSFAHNLAIVFSFATSLMIELFRLKIIVLLAFLSISAICSRVFYKDASFLSLLVVGSIASPCPCVIKNASILNFHVLKLYSIILPIKIVKINFRSSHTCI